MNAVTRFRERVKSTLTAIAHWGVPCVEPRIARVLPHDRCGFTQGLAFHQDMLYESTGGKSNSSLRRLSAEDGEIQELVPIPGDFAEGIACLEDRLFQLSWKSGVAREFTLPDLELIGTHRYSGEGWGLAATGDRLLSSDGSNRLRYWTPQFELLDEIHLVSNRVPIRWLNDLECVGDRVYLNVVACPFILELDSKSRQLLRLINCRALIEYESPDLAHQILNGIAYHAARNAFYVTGKQWRSLFVIEIPE